MAVCKVLKQTSGWNVGDDIEVFGDTLVGYVQSGVVEVLVPDIISAEEIKPEETKVEEIKTDVILDKPHRGRPKKGV